MANSASSRRALYPTIWRWHFYAGLLVAPFVVMLALSGGLYLYEREIESAWYGPWMHVAPQGEARPLSVQAEAVLQAFPGGALRNYFMPLAPDRSAEWALMTAEGSERVAFVDPYRASVLGSVREDRRVRNVLFYLHGELMLGRFGNAVVELAACWTFVLLITGIYLWWPRRAPGLGAVVPRLGLRGRRFWRDLHAVPAVWNAGLIAFLVISGLPWSTFWGGQLTRLGAVSPSLASSPMFAPPPARTVPGEAPSSGPSELPWGTHHAELTPAPASAARIGIDEVARIARELGVEEPGLRVIYPQGAAGAFTLSLIPDRAQGQRVVHIDPSSGAVFQDIPWSGFSPLARVVTLGVQMHTGRQFGPWNRIVLTIGALLLLGTVGSGITMWWMRRPRGRFLAAPPARADVRLPGPVIACIAALAIVFPLLGLSIVLIWATERWIVRPRGRGRRRRDRRGGHVDTEPALLARVNSQA